VTFADPNLGSTQVTVKQQINVLKMGINYGLVTRCRSSTLKFSNSTFTFSDLPQYPHT
jgi:hypothetical protein